MSSTSPVSEIGSESSKQGRCGSRAHWSGANITAMVIGFVLFWPAGLFMVYWILTGRRVQDLPQAARDKFAGMRGGRRGRCQRRSESGNVMFDEYQQTQWDRIAEIRQEISERARRFNEWREEARRRADDKEFKDFMANAPASDRS